MPPGDALMQAGANPVQHAAGAAHHKVALGPSPPGQFPVQVGVGGHQNQPLPGPGHAHIQKPRFLAALLPVLLHGHGAGGEGFLLHLRLRHHQGEGQAGFSVCQQGQALFLSAELGGQVRHDHHRELQPLGLVQGHHPHHVLLLAQAGAAPAALFARVLQPL